MKSNVSIWKLFELGFEEMKMQQIIVGDSKKTYHKEDFALGGCMEAFKNYSVNRFEHEFCCVVYFG